MQLNRMATRQALRLHYLDVMQENHIICLYNQTLISISKILFLE
jgi:hypothetical protein